MKYQVNYYVGDDLRSKIIVADNLDNAEEIWYQLKIKADWEDIILVDKTKGISNY
ncbi:MAG: hypothetical protein M0R03_08670 [Novosphingobium sp.]|nr:hypothetical protein [Novosphingobium sp.]